MKNYDLVIVGGGAAGLAAALKAKENGIDSIIIIEKDKELGGILQQCIHNGFGLHYFKEELTGPQYAQKFIDMVNEKNIEYKINTYVFDVTKDRKVYCSNEEGISEIHAKAIIFSTGSSERTRGAISIPGDRPKGVITAGTAQKYLNMEGYLVGKKVFILGSGDIGLIMARRMSLEGAKVLGVAEIQPFSNGLARNIVQCLEDFNIPLYLSTTVTNIIGKDKIEKIELTKVDKKFNPIKGSSWEEEVDCLLLSVGLIPANDLLSNLGSEISEKTKGSIVNESMETSIPGIFSCGNTLHIHDLVDFVTNESERAGINAAKFIKKGFKNKEKGISTKPLNGVSYLVPHLIRLENIDDELELFLRVTNVFKNVKFLIKSDGNIIKEIKKLHLAPAEMESIKIKKDLLKDTKNEIAIEIMEA